MESFCNQCPRHCKVNRERQIGFCSATDKCEIAKVMLHHWEEPIISGDENMAGSGAIFFSHCNLKCVYCQNYEISHKDNGELYSTEQLVNLFKELELKGALNINLVTPTHYSEYILQALKIYKPNIPVVWNCGGYEDVAIVEKLKDYVDIFLTDFKYFSNDLALKYSACPDYFDKCAQAILKMREICQQDIIEKGLMKKGIIVRHMVLPNHTDDSIKVLEWIQQNLGTDTYVSLMSQYTPHGQANKYEEINRKLKPLEYKRVLNHLYDLGFKNGFTQDFSSASEEFIPDFKREDKNTI